MSLPEPGQPANQKETATIPAAPAPTVPAVEDAGQFVKPTVAPETTGVVTPVPNIPQMPMPQGVEYAAEAVPLTVNQQPLEEQVSPDKAIQFPNMGFTGRRASGDAGKWHAILVEKWKKQKLKAA